MTSKLCYLLPMFKSLKRSLFAPVFFWVFVSACGFRGCDKKTVTTEEMQDSFLEGAEDQLKKGLADANAAIKALKTVEKEDFDRHLSLFRKAQSPSEKLRAAMNLAMDHSRVEPPLPDWMAKELETLTQAETFLNDLERQAIAFENSLSLADIQFITQENPLEPARTTGKLSIYKTAHFNVNQCGAEELKKLKTKFAPEKLLSVVNGVMSFNISVRNTFEASYKRRVHELLKQKGSESQHHLLLETFYAPPKEWASEDLPKGISKDSETFALTRAREAFAETPPLSEEQLKKRIYELSIEFPGCLGVTDLTLLNRIRKELFPES